MILLFDIGNTHTHVGLANHRRVFRNVDVPTAGWFTGAVQERVAKFAGPARVDGVAASRQQRKPTK